MITREVWEDKLSEDKVIYYNKTRMSLELFSKKVGVSPQLLKKDLERSGYRYVETTRRFEDGWQRIIRKKLCRS